MKTLKVFGKRIATVERNKRLTVVDNKIVYAEKIPKPPKPPKPPREHVPFPERVLRARKGFMAGLIDGLKGIGEGSSGGGGIVSMPWWGWVFYYMIKLTLICVLITAALALVVGSYLAFTVVYWIALGVASWRRRRAAKAAQAA